MAGSICGWIRPVGSAGGGGDLARARHLLAACYLLEFRPHGGVLQDTARAGLGAADPGGVFRKGPACGGPCRTAALPWYDLLWDLSLASARASGGDAGHLGQRADGVALRADAHANPGCRVLAPI